MKKSIAACAISAGALLLALLAPSAAFAASKTGYVECNSDRQVSIASTISKASKDQATLHVSSVRSYAHYGSGSFSNKNAISATKWEVRSNGTIGGASASCTK